MKHAFLAFLLLGLPTFSVQAASLRVTLLQAEEGPAYREFALSFTSHAAQQKTLSIDQANVLPPDADTDLVVAVGLKSAEIALKSRFPVLVVLVSKAGFEKLQQELAGKREGKIVSAIYLDQPNWRQLDLIAAALPEAKNIGLLFSAQSSHTSGLRKAIEATRFVLHEQQLESAATLHRDLHTLLQKTDILFAIPDLQIYNASTMRNILLETYRSGIPMLGFSPAYVRAGALCAVFSTAEQTAIQAVYQVMNFAETKNMSAPQYATEFEVMTNPQVARSLSIRIKEPSALLSQLKAIALAREGKK